MCKRNSPDKNEASTGCVRETPHIKIKSARDVCTGCVHGMCEGNSLDKLKKKKRWSQHGMCKRKSPDKIKPARGV